ncbi:ExeM/NucH family extracellular endonuclease [Lysobacter soli]|uniref:ExeM/NucH family extracellular endonuclease n=1 Tax=Lysobacter soli TaxID=453783 RepID=UPI00240FAB60|nr:ExeM/NucH family extracellular endonuclease [Lysobacter soli]MDG2517622.1 ExeM/NucH family extracellular endonuclease [Lysobacter soli]
MTRSISLLRPALLLSPCLLIGCASAPGAGAATAIGAVQGRAERSALVGQTVTVRGTVSAIAEGGWFLQDEGDGDDATSDAIFVQQAAPTVQPGDAVRARGTVAELDAGRGMRTSLVDAEVERTGRGDVAALALTAAPADWERLEGMRVRLDGPVYLADSGDLARHGRVQVSLGERLWQPTERHVPGSDGYRAEVEGNARRTVWLDAANAEWLAGLAQARSGSRIDGATGVIDETKAGIALHLNAAPTLDAAPRPQAPSVPGTLRVAALNLENLFNGDGHGGGFPTLRGARTPQELTAQLAKHVAIIEGLNADVVALMELENDGYGKQSSIATLVDALNADGSRWRFVDAKQGPGDNPIRVGLIYHADRVRTLGAPKILEGGPFGEHSRVPMAQAFAPLKGDANRQAFVVVANHFKSKGCKDAEGLDRDQHDGASCYNAMRTESARRLHAWLATDPTGHGARTLIVGDLNAYAQEEPVRTLREAGWQDAFVVAGNEAPYSYVYDGQLGRLDHALLSPEFAKRLRGAAEWHVNADEPESAGYRAGGAGPWRSSDHDPLVLGFDP